MAEGEGITPLYAATKLFEGDELMENELGLSDEMKHIIGEILTVMEKKVGMERAAVMADTRYRFIEQRLAECVVRNPHASGNASMRIDRILTNRVLAIPVFLAIMLLVFYLTFGPFGTMVTGAFSGVVDWGIDMVGSVLGNWDVALWVRNLAIKGVLTGVGSVLSFMPTILILFLLLSILEDSGYMARAAFLMDQPLRKLGLNGRSFIPIMMGFGCTVPAVMSARSMRTQRDRRFTILLTPFMSCGAKVPIYALFTMAFFPGQQVLVMSGLYLAGILMAIIAGLLLKKLVFHGDASPFIMELPSYRLPTARNVCRQMWDKAKDFIRRAFTVIFLATLAVWFLQNFTFSLTQAQDISHSMLGRIGDAISRAFVPVGFGNVEASIAVLTGIIAKESVVSTLSVLSSAEVGSTQILACLHGIFPSTLSAVSFLLFVLLYMPCVAVFAVMRREMEGNRWAILSALGQTAVAWVVAWAVFQAGRLLGLG